MDSRQSELEIGRSISRWLLWPRDIYVRLESSGAPATSTMEPFTCMYDACTRISNTYERMYQCKYYVPNHEWYLHDADIALHPTKDWVASISANNAIQPKIYTHTQTDSRTKLLWIQCDRFDTDYAHTFRSQPDIGTTAARASREKKFSVDIPSPLIYCLSESRLKISDVRNVHIMKHVSIYVCMYVYMYVCRYVRIYSVYVYINVFMNVGTNRIRCPYFQFPFEMRFYNPHNLFVL